MDTVPESNLQALRVMKQATGLTMRVTPYEVVTRIKQVTETTIVVQLRVYQAEERRTEVILKNQGTRLVQYSLTDNGLDNPRQAVKLVDTVFRILLVIGIIWLIATWPR
jgi:hypothetical protein